MAPSATRSPSSNQVQAGDLFGDRVLDLKARVDFGKGDRIVVLDEEFHGGQPGVAGRPGQRQRRLGQPRADRVPDQGRRDLDQLLPPPLQAAVTVTQHGHGAGAVADDLDLHVPGPGQQLLDVDPGVAEGRRRLRRAPAHRPGEIGRTRHRPHAAPAAAGDRLDHDRAVLAQQGPRLLQRRVAVGAGQDGHAKLARPGPGRALVAEQRERAGPGTGEAHPRFGAARGQLRPLGCEAVPGVEHVAARAGGRGHDRSDVEVGGRARTRQLDRRVGPADMAAGGVVGGIDRDGLDAEHGRRCHDADGDLAPVGDEQSLDHRPGFLSSLGERVVGGGDHGVDLGPAVQDQVLHRTPALHRCHLLPGPADTRQPGVPPIVNEAEDSWPVRRGPSHCRPGTKTFLPNGPALSTSAPTRHGGPSPTSVRGRRPLAAPGSRQPGWEQDGERSLRSCFSRLCWR